MHILGILLLDSMDEISALKSNDNVWSPKGCVPWKHVNLKRVYLITILFHCLCNREVISQTCQRPNIKYISSTGKSAMRYDISMDLARGFSTATKQLRDHFLPTGKMLAKQFHFYSDPSSTLRLSSQIAIANHQPECRPLGKAILGHLSCAFRVLSDKRLVRGLGVSLSLFSQWACSTLVCGGCLRDFSPRQVLGFLYCGIFAIGASAFREFSTLWKGCWERRFDGFDNACVKRVLLHATQFKDCITALRTSGL